MVTQNIMRTYEGKQVFSENRFIFVAALDLIKFLKQIKYQRLLPLTCALISELLSNMLGPWSTLKHETFQKLLNEDLLFPLNKGYIVLLRIHSNIFICL